MAISQLILLQVLNSIVMIAILVLVGMGLGVIFGLMGVINLAHGEFLMLGAYSVVIAGNLGLNFWWGMCLGIVLVGIVGFLLERGLIRFLYRRPIDSLLATWGVALILQQLIRLWFGPAPQTVVAPIQGAVQIAGLAFPTYRLFVVGVGLVVAAGMIILFRYPTFGLKSRAVLQDVEMAKSLGIRAPRIYTTTFMIGSALAGLAGALVAPMVGVQPFMGAPYLVTSFMTVIVGGVGNLVGVVGGAGVIGGTQGFVSYFSSSVLAQVVVLAIAIAIVRIRPTGIFTRK
jgi:urea transport system permease protein